MVRSMYSGVSGLRSHQTRMDTIGNNIANVNTYGFKSGRTTFRDIYYQGVKTASSPTAAMGGINPSAVGYGTQVGSVDVMMGRSTLTMTDQTMDVAIDGDGFLQVQDSSGNIYYTRAGMLNFDSAGNLVDMQGNYVLGVNGDPTGKGPGSERITVNLPSVQPTAGSATQTINGIEYEFSFSNTTVDSNLNLNFEQSTTMTDGVKAQATVGTYGIIITLNANETFSSFDELNNAINDAITEANGGTQHVAGELTISTTDGTDPFAAGALTGADIASTNYGVTLGSANFSGSNKILGSIYPNGKVGTTFGAGFSSTPPLYDDMDVTYSVETDGTEVITFKVDIDGMTYEGSINSSVSTSSSGNFQMKNTNGDKDDYFEMRRGSFEAVRAQLFKDNAAPADGVTLADATTVVDASSVNAGTTGFGALVPGDTTATFDATNNAWVVTISDGTDTFTASVPAGHTGGTLTFSDGTDTITARVPAFSELTKMYGAEQMDGVPVTFDAVTDLGNGVTAPSATASKDSSALGFSSTAIALRGGTAGGAQTLADMTGIYIAANGVITGIDSVGTEIIIGRIDIATFANAAGLNQVGSTNFAVSANSGEAKLSQPGTGGSGQLVAGSLELSNVDLSREFSDMITTQRGYQANSRIITVSDTMLEELINLKR